jgi:hypothetical protein
LLPPHIYFTRVKTLGVSIVADTRAKTDKNRLTPVLSVLGTLTYGFVEGWRPPWVGEGRRARASIKEELFYYHISGETITVLAASTYLDLPDSTISFINPSMGLSVEYTVT